MSPFLKFGLVCGCFGQKNALEVLMSKFGAQVSRGFAQFLSPSWTPVTGMCQASLLEGGTHE